MTELKIDELQQVTGGAPQGIQINKAPGSTELRMSPEMIKQILAGDKGAVAAFGSAVKTSGFGQQR